MGLRRGTLAQPTQGPSPQQTQQCRCGVGGSHSPIHLSQIPLQKLPVQAEECIQPLLLY